MATARRPSVPLTITVAVGQTMTLSSVVSALMTAGLPVDAEVSKEDFLTLLQLVTPELVQRDTDGVYVDVVRCRIRPPAV